MFNLLWDEIIDCSVTIQDTICELIKIENQLAIRYSLVDNPAIQNYHRISLFEMNIANKLIEDELVRNWHESYSSYCDWINHSPLYATVFIVRPEDKKYYGFTGKIIEKATNEIRLGKPENGSNANWPSMIYYNVRLANRIPMIFSNREIIYL